VFTRKNATYARASRDSPATSGLAGAKLPNSTRWSGARIADPQTRCGRGNGDIAIIESASVRWTCCPLIAKGQDLKLFDSIRWAIRRASLHTRTTVRQPQESLRRLVRDRPDDYLRPRSRRSEILQSVQAMSSAARRLAPTRVLRTIRTISGQGERDPEGMLLTALRSW